MVTDPIPGLHSATRRLPVHISRKERTPRQAGRAGKGEAFSYESVCLQCVSSAPPSLSFLKQLKNIVLLIYAEI